MALQVSSMQLSVKVKSDSSDLRRDMAATEAAIQDVAATTKAANDEITSHHKALARQSAETVKNLQAASREQVRDIIGQSATTLNSLKSANQEQAQEIANQSRFTRQQLMTLQYTASDVAASLGSGASPFTVLLQQGGQVLQVFPKVAGAIGVIGAVTALIGAPIAVVAARMLETASATRTLSVTMNALHADAAVTGAELQAFAVAAIRVGASRAEAYEAALALARSPALATKEVFRDILALAPDVAAVIGGTVPSAAERMGKAFSAGTDGIKELDGELNFLSLAQRRQIEALEVLRDRQEMQAVAVKAMQERYRGAAQAMRSDWGAALHEIGLAWDAYVDHIASSPLPQWMAAKMGAAGKAAREALEQDASTASRSAQLAAELAKVESEYQRLPEKTSGVQPTHEALILRRIALQQELNALTSQGNEEVGESAKRAADNEKLLAASLDEAMSASEFSLSPEDVADALLIFEGAIE